MKRPLLLATIGVALVLLIGAALWWFRPGAEFAPAEVYRFSKAEDRRPAYRVMETIYPHKVIEGAAKPFVLPRAETEIADGYTWNGIEKTAGDYAEAHRMTGLMVVHDGEVVLERYYGGETAEDRHTSWSVAKSVVATLIGRALMEGRIASLDDPVSAYTDAYDGSDYANVSLRHLLMMSSGIDFDEDYEVDGSDIRKLFFGTFFWNRDVDGIVADHKQDRAPGQDFDYISANTAVLAAVLRGAYERQGLADLAQEKLFMPLGLRGGTWLTDSKSEDGKELGYCCLQVTLQDYALLGQLYLDGGVARATGTRVVPADWPAFVATPPQESHEPGSAGRPDGHGYGHHFWVPDGGTGEFYMSGYNGQVVWIDPARQVVVAMTGADQSWPAAKSDFTQMARALAEAASAR